MIFAGGEVIALLGAGDDVGEVVDMRVVMSLEPTRPAACMIDAIFSKSPFSSRPID
jgi:hypothetical protein